MTRLGAASSLHDRLFDLASYEAALAAGALELYAEDLLRGHRVDVWDSRSSRWHSVMKRRGRYELAGGVTIPVEDEGFVATSASRHPVASEDLYLPESVFWWDGWSLSQPSSRSHARHRPFGP